jgi:hypothetical protein
LDEEEKKVYKRKYMSKKKNKDNDIRPVSQEEFDRFLTVALNTPARKRNKKDRAKLV